NKILIGSITKIGNKYIIDGKLMDVKTGASQFGHRESTWQEEDLDMCTQRDASTKIGIGAYSDRYTEQEARRQQFLLGDTRSLDEVIAELSELGRITSFCTSGYRCGRTGDHIMKLLKSGQESRFCKLNAVLTFREWLDDFASEKTKAAGERLIEKELAEIRARVGSDFTVEMLDQLLAYQARINKGERDLCF
ncbi:MAG TPA: hypothetical protein PLL10_02235, partial [Elusimicrobiales bacterium]|nr:hypothetical protein [Elusimicrobiales bacterium]